MRFIILCWLCAVAHLQFQSSAFGSELTCYPYNPGLPCPALNPENGHFYAYSRLTGSTIEEFSWHTARSQAESFTHLGLRGHLATVTSASENAFLKSVIGRETQYWIGASDLDVNGEWRWMVGPEAGELFWRGGPDGEAFGFNDWAPGEPNDVFAFPEQHEPYALLNSFYNNFQGWNDARDFETIYFTVEFSPVPEPSTYALAAIGLIAMAGVIRRRKRR